MKRYIEIIILIILGGFVINTLISFAINNHVLNLNHYLGFFAWALVAIIYFFINKSYGRYGLLIILLLGTLNFLNFTIYYVWAFFSYPIIDELNGIGIQPLSLLLLIIYSLIRFTSVQEILFGNKKEREDKSEKLVDFYLKKFTTLTDKEFEEVVRNYKEYPLEAKMAIDKLKLQKVQG